MVKLVYRKFFYKFKDCEKKTENEGEVCCNDKNRR